MNIKIYGKLPVDDKKTIKNFTCYVLSLFDIDEDISINIKFVEPTTKDLRKFSAEMEQKTETKYTIFISTKMRTMKNKLLCVGHELIHVIQYVSGDLIDYPDGRVKYKGKFYSDWQYGKGYYFSPWELEAYAYEPGLYETFIEESSK